MHARFRPNLEAIGASTFYEGRRRENRYIVDATAKPPMIMNTTSIAADCVSVDAIANTARPTLSANTSLTTRNTVKPLSVAR